MAALFTGCGNSGSEDTSDQVYYHIQETSIPDPDEGLRDVFRELTRVSEQDFVLKAAPFTVLLSAGRWTKMVPCCR